MPRAMTCGTLLLAISLLRTAESARRSQALGRIEASTLQGSAETKPGDDDFEPTLEWVSEELQVPIRDCQCKRLGGGGSKGASGASFFKCTANYSGSVLHPTLGLPEKLFIKVRNKTTQDPSEFEPERGVSALTAHMSDGPALPALLSSDRDFLLSEMAGSPVEDDYAFTKADVKDVLNTYAKFHASFWGLHDSPGLHLKPFEEWAALFAPGMPPDMSASAYKAAWDYGVDWYQLPNADVLKRLNDEVGISKIAAYIKSISTSVIQGDAHRGQILRKDGGDWALIDFGNACLNHPAIDIGALVPALSPGEQIEPFRHYHQQISHLLPGVLSQSEEEFVMLAKIGSMLRGIFLLYFVVAPAVPEEMYKDPNFWHTHTSENIQTHFGLLWDYFAHFDHDVLDYVKEKAAALDPQSLLSLSQSSRPAKATLDAFAARGNSLRDRLEALQHKLSQ